GGSRLAGWFQRADRQEAVSRKMSTAIKSEARKSQSEIRVGDLIQYRFPSSALGTSLDTRQVIEIVATNGGAIFVVEGFYNVKPFQIVTHIPAEGDPVEDDDYWFCGELD